MRRNAPQKIRVEQESISSDLQHLVDLEFAKDSLSKTGYDGRIQPVSWIAYNEQQEPVGIIECRLFWGTLHIRKLFVFPAYRKQGIAKTLVEVAILHAKKCGCSVVFVETMDFQARGFYEKIGFEREFSRHGFAKNTNMHFLRKELND